MILYIENMKKHIISLIVGIAVVGLGLFFQGQFSANDGIGVDLPAAPALFETSLAAPISSSATTLTLTSNSVRGGGSLSGYNCFTIDEGSAQAEFVCGTVSGTSVTSLTRGLSPSDGTTETASLQFSHRRGANIKITDFPIIQLIRAQNNGDATYENVLSYAATVVPSGANELADVGYVLSVVNGGTVSFDQLTVSGTAGETVATGTLVYLKASDQEWYKVDTDDTTTFQNVPVGLVQSASTDGNSIASGILLHGLDNTQSGLTAGDDYYATSTAGTIDTASTALLVGRAKDADELELYFNPLFDLTYNTWTGTNTFTSATTTFDESITGHASTTYTVYTASTTWTKPSEFEYIIVEAQGAGDNGSTDGAGGTGGGYSKELFTADDLSGTTSVQIVVGFADTTGSSNFGGLLYGYNGASGGSASGGDLNIDGGTGGSGAGGAGGSSFMGFGGDNSGIVSATAGRNGGAGKGYGAGGAGGKPASDGDPSGYTGGASTNGVVIITVYY